AHCPRKAVCRFPSFKRPEHAHIRAATKPKDSQVPTPKTADGSNSSTAANACHHVAHADNLPLRQAHANAANIKTLRCVGTEKPASSA
ncbi:hypothetical protein LN386_26235, partial [Enterobacter hormaechei subsp. steigerwaltii]|nr:hypothetical protein [Enterobacter hormaechei subsp. steigerwaltii]